MPLCLAAFYVQSAPEPLVVTGVKQGFLIILFSSLKSLVLMTLPEQMEEKQIPFSCRYRIIVACLLHLFLKTVLVLPFPSSLLSSLTSRCSSTTSHQIQAWIFSLPFILEYTTISLVFSCSRCNDCFSTDKVLCIQRLVCH